MGQAVFQQNSGCLAITVVTNCGVMTPTQLRQLGELAESLNLPALKLTSRQTIVLLTSEDKLEELNNRLTAIGLKMGSYGGVIRNVKACCGSPDLCNRYIGDALTLGIEIQEKYLDQTVPKDFKISTAGCARGCTDPYCADFGVVAVTRNLFDIYIAGRGSSKKPRHGVKLAEKVTKEQVFEVLDYVLAVYREKADPGERLCYTVDRIGVEAFSLPRAEKVDALDQDGLEFVRFLEDAGEV